ncbi:MAG: ATP-binding protein [Armatimonadota bacterium]
MDDAIIDGALALPSWTEDIRAKYESGAASQFLLHTNIYDVYPLGGVYLRLREFLTQSLAGAPQMLVAYYNLADGLSFGSDQMLREFLAFYKVRGSIAGHSTLQPDDWEAVRAELRDPRVVLPILGRLLSLRNNVFLFIDHAEKIAPAGEAAGLSLDDRRHVTLLQRWGFEPAFLARNNFIILVSEHQSTVHPDLWRGNPQLDSVRIPFPDEPERLRFIQSVLRREPLQTEMPPERLAGLTAGLSLIKIEGLLKQARRGDARLTFDEVARRKNELIEDEYGGLIKVVEPRHGLDAVAGMQAAKEELRVVIDAFRRGDTANVPMAIGLLGPPGTGKSYIGIAIAKELGVPIVEIGNLRAEYVGQSERNSEKVINFLESVGGVVVLWDEIDQTYGQRGERGDSGVSQRLWGMWSKFLADSRHRGRILVIWMTNRPDAMDEATKRPGRLGDLKIPIFYAADDPLGVLRIVAEHLRARLPDDLAPVADKIAEYSPAEIEALVTVARRTAPRQDGTPVLAADHLISTAERYRPTRNETMIEFMELQAALESTFQDFLAERYRTMSRAAMEARAHDLRLRLTAMGLI